METFMTGKPEFADMAFYDEFVGCMNSIDPTLLTSVGAQWDGMLAFAAAGGDPANGDPWPECNSTLISTDGMAQDTRGVWFEYNCTVQEYGDMLIFEPCNYASNLAYYHTVTEICGHKSWTLDMEDGDTITSSIRN